MLCDHSVAALIFHCVSVYYGPGTGGGANMQAAIIIVLNYRVFLSTVTNKSSITDTIVHSLTQFGYFSCSIHQVI